MTRTVGETAVVVGAGMSGLTAAAALSDFFSQVIILERDELPAKPAHRPSIPQGRHTHGLLWGGLRALTQLFPGFGDDLAAAGAVRVRAGLDLRLERPGYDPFPQRDLGWDAYALSRPLIEFVVRRRTAALPNVSVRSQSNVTEIVPAPTGAEAAGVRYKSADGRFEILNADYIVDASARGVPTLTFLQACGAPLPKETSIGVDMTYATAIFKIPADAPAEWKGVMVIPDPKLNSRFGLLFPLEGDRWILSVGAPHGDKPPADPDGFMRYVEGIRTPTIFSAVSRAESIDKIERFGFPASVRRHFESLESFPRRVLPIGDAICRFNPMYGQGMSVAAIEAQELKLRLERWSGGDDRLDCLAPEFFAAIGQVLDTPWDVAKLDFIHPQTRGDRPDGFENTLKFLVALNRLAAREPAVHKLMMEVQHLMKPNTVYRDPEFRRKIAAELAAP
jgi:2-polyprenyl-6-methoxyphenol hydroxylase-like FAD-dependent oxidoreductase